MDCLNSHSEDRISEEEEYVPLEVNVKIEVEGEDNENEGNVSHLTSNMKPSETITPDFLPPTTLQEGSDGSISIEGYHGVGDKRKYSLRNKISSLKTTEQLEDCSNRTEIKERKKMTMRQTAMLVNFMAEHRSFAAGKVKGPVVRKQHSEMWDKLCHLLALHGSTKTVVQLKKACKDLKHKTRAKYARLGRQLNDTENKERPITHLSVTDQKVLHIIGRKRFLDNDDMSKATSEGQNDVSQEGPISETLPITPTEVSTGSSPMVVTEESSSVTVTREKQHSTSSPINNLKEFQLITANNFSSRQTRKKSLRERLEDVHSRIDSSEARQEGVLESIAESLSSLAASHQSSLSLQREKLHLLQQTLQLENDRLKKLDSIIESQEQIASALRTLVSSSSKKEDSAH